MPEPRSVELKSRRQRRIRVGILLMLLSWIPAPIVARALDNLLSAPLEDSAAHTLTALVWTVEILVGMLGAVLAGKETLAVVHSVGWRRTPSVVWRLMIHGESADTP